MLLEQRSQTTELDIDAVSFPDGDIIFCRCVYFCERTYDETTDKRVSIEHSCVNQLHLDVYGEKYVIDVLSVPGSQQDSCSLCKTHDGVIALAIADGAKFRIDQRYQSKSVDIKGEDCSASRLFRKMIEKEMVLVN